MNKGVTSEHIEAQGEFVRAALAPGLHQREIDQALVALDNLETHQAQVMSALELWHKRLRFSMELYADAGDKHPERLADGVRQALTRYTRIVRSLGAE